MIGAKGRAATVKIAPREMPTFHTSGTSSTRRWDTMKRTCEFVQMKGHGRSNMRVGILGSGLMGAKLGTIFARAGHEIVFSYARSNDKLKRLAREAKGNARAGTP